MGDVTKLPSKERCTLCGKDPASIYADLDVIIRYRDDASNRYRTHLRVCIHCSDFLVVSRETVVTPVPEPPQPIRHDMPKCSCGQPAAVRINTGELKCSTCAFR